MIDYDDEEIDYTAAMARAGEIPRTTANAVSSAVLAPPEALWAQVLEYVAHAMPVVRAYHLCGLRPDRMRAWLKTNPDAQTHLDAVRASASQRLLGVVWHEALHGNDGDGNWKAALSLLQKVDAAFDGQYRRKRVETPGATVNITAATAQVIASSDVDALRKVLGNV